MKRGARSCLKIVDIYLNVASVLRVVHMMVDIDLRVFRDLLVVVPLDVDQPLPHVVDFVLFRFPSYLLFLAFFEF